MMTFILLFVNPCRLISDLWSYFDVLPNWFIVDGLLLLPRTKECLLPTKVDGCFFSYSFGQSSSKTNIFLVFLIDPPLTMVVFTYNIIQKLNNSEFCISIFSCQQLKNYKMSIFLSMPKTQAVLGPQSVLGPLLYGPKHRAGLSTRSTERTRSIIVWTKIVGRVKY